MCMPRCQTRLCGQGAHLNKAPGIWCATSCQRHSDFATRHIAPPGHKRSGFLVESTASQRHVEYFSVRLGRSRGLGWTWEDRHVVRPMSIWPQALNHDLSWHWGANGYVVWSRAGLWSLICACRGLRPDCDDRVRISIKSLENGAPPRVKDIQTSLLGPLYPHDTNDRVSRQNQQRRSAMSSTFWCDLCRSQSLGWT